VQSRYHSSFEQLSRPRWRRYLLRLGLLSLLWFGLNGGEVMSWIIGVPTVVLAAAINFPFLPRGAWQLQMSGVLPMAWFFLKESYLGAFDVALRAFTPSLPINPSFVNYECRLHSTSARLFFTTMVTLMPGTLSVRANGSHIVIHALDVSAGVESSLRALEEKVAALFGARLEANREARS